MSDATYREIENVSGFELSFWSTFIRRWGTFSFFVVMVICFCLINPFYFTWINFSNLLYEAVVPVCMSLGLTIVVMVGSFDLSIGAIASFGGMVTALLFPHIGTLPACLIGLMVSGLFGLLNGILVGVIGISGIIATLALQFICTGIEITITGGIEISIPLSFTKFLAFGQESIGPFKVLISVLVVLGILTHLFMTKTAWGVKISATGINPMASVYSGIRIKGVVILAFILSGLFSGLAGILICEMNSSHQPATAHLNLLDAFCIVFLGSTILKEGKAHILGTVLAGIILSSMVTGLMFCGVHYEWQLFAKGFVLIFAIVVSALLKHEEIRTQFA